MRVLGVVIANPGAPEANVFAKLLAHRNAKYDALVIHQEWGESHSHTIAFEREAQASIVPVDVGWRPSHGRPRRVSAKGVSLARFVAASPGLIGIARAYRPDVIYSSQQRWDSFIAAQLADRLGVPHIVHLHYNVGSSLGSEVLNRLRSRAHVVAVSDFIRVQALRHGLDPARVTTIRNALEPSGETPGARESVRRELGLKPSSLAVGIVARLTASKGQRDAIAAFARVAKDSVDPRLFVVGDGEDEGLLRNTVADLGLSERVIFTGRRNDIPRLLGAFDVFVHPSREEPFGLAVLEAMSSGLPIVAYADGALPEIVEDGRSGLLVPVGDVGELALAISTLLKRPDLRRALGDAAWARVATSFRPETAGRMFSEVVYEVGRPN